MSKHFWKFKHCLKHFMVENLFLHFQILFNFDFKFEEIREKISDFPKNPNLRMNYREIISILKIFELICKINYNILKNCNLGKNFFNEIIFILSALETHSENFFWVFTHRNSPCDRQISIKFLQRKKALDKFKPIDKINYFAFLSKWNPLPRLW